MYIQQGSMRIHDNFKMGIVKTKNKSPTVNLAFTDRDFDGTVMEEFATTNVFQIAEDSIDKLIEMLLAAKGDRIHMPTPEELRNLGAK